MYMYMQTNACDGGHSGAKQIKSHMGSLYTKSPTPNEVQEQRFNGEKVRLKADLCTALKSYKVLT